MSHSPPNLVHLRKRRTRYDAISSAAGAFTFVVGMVGAMYDGLRWLQTGAWQPVDGWGVARALSSGSWLDSPQRFLYLHKVVAIFLGMPLFLTGPFVFWLIVGGMLSALASLHRRRARPTAQDDFGIEEEIEKAA